MEEKVQIVKGGGGVEREDKKDLFLAIFNGFFCLSPSETWLKLVNKCQFPEYENFYSSCNFNTVFGQNIYLNELFNGQDNYLLDFGKGTQILIFIAILEVFFALNELWQGLQNNIPVYFLSQL